MTGELPTGAPVVALYQTSRPCSSSSRSTGSSSKKSSSRRSRGLEADVRVARHQQYAAVLRQPVGDRADHVDVDDVGDVDPDLAGHVVEADQVEVVERELVAPGEGRPLAEHQPRPVVARRLPIHSPSSSIRAQNSEHLGQHPVELVERQHVRPVARRAVGVGVDLDEQRVDADGRGGPGEVGRTRGGRPTRSPSPPGMLDAVGGVEDDRVAELAHLGQRAEVDDEVVVAERRAALGEHDAGRQPASSSFADDVAHVPGARNWPFLTLTARPVARGGDERSVWRHRNAGIWSTSTPRPTGSACPGSWMSVITGDAELALHAGEDLEPVVDARARGTSAIDERLALSNEDLNTKPTSCRGASSRNEPATSSMNASSSIRHGPAISSSGAPSPAARPSAISTRLMGRPAGHRPRAIVAEWPAWAVAASDS